MKRVILAGALFGLFIAGSVALSVASAGAPQPHIASITVTPVAKVTPTTTTVPVATPPTPAPPVVAPAPTHIAAPTTTTTVALAPTPSPDAAALAPNPTPQCRLAWVAPGTNPNDEGQTGVQTDTGTQGGITMDCSSVTANEASPTFPPGTTFTVTQLS